MALRSILLLYSTAVYKSKMKFTITSQQGQACSVNRYNLSFALCSHQALTSSHPHNKLYMITDTWVNDRQSDEKHQALSLPVYLACRHQINSTVLLHYNPYLYVYTIQLLQKNPVGMSTRTYQIDLTEHHWRFGIQN